MNNRLMTTAAANDAPADTGEDGTPNVLFVEDNTILTVDDGNTGIDISQGN